MSAIETVNRYLQALEGSEDPFVYLADDFEFHGPLLQANSKAEFMQGLAAMGPMQPQIEMLRQFEEKGEVCSIYHFIVGTTPIVMAEWAVVKNERIVSQRLIYDTKAFEAAITH